MHGGKLQSLSGLRSARGRWHASVDAVGSAAQHGVCGWVIGGADRESICVYRAAFLPPAPSHPSHRSLVSSARPPHNSRAATHRFTASGRHRGARRHMPRRDIFAVVSVAGILWRAIPYSRLQTVWAVGIAPTVEQLLWNHSWRCERGKALAGAAQLLPLNSYARALPRRRAGPHSTICVLRASHPKLVPAPASPCALAPTSPPENYVIPGRLGPCCHWPTLRPRQRSAAPCT
jgi:hypothetical protein